MSDGTRAMAARPWWVPGGIAWRTRLLVGVMVVMVLAGSAAPEIAVATDADIDVGADGDSISVEIGTPPDVADGGDGSTDSGLEQAPGR